MAKKSKKFNKRYRNYLIAGAIVLVIGAAALTVLALRNNNSSGSAANDNTTANGNLKTSSTGSKYSTTPLSPDVNTPNDQRKANSDSSQTLDNNSGSGSLMVTLTGVNQLPGSSQVNVGTLVNGISDGSCRVVASLAGQPSVSASSSVVLVNNSYQCGNFKLTSSQFPVSGHWYFVVTVTSGSLAGSDNNYGDINK